MIEKIFKSNWAFYLLVLFVWGGLLLAADRWIQEEFERQRLKTDVLNEIQTLKLSSENLQKTKRNIKEDVEVVTREVEKLDKELDRVEEILFKKRAIYHRWRSRDMVGFCRQAQRLNPGWRCPNIDEIIEKGNEQISKERAQPQ